MPTTKTHRTKTVTVRVGPRLRADLERYAELREMSVGEFLRYCALVYMDSTPSDPDEMDGYSAWASDEEEAANTPLEIARVKRGE